ncbi:guanyl-nucleotide exchange factor [Schizosaccharomyces cryophilus OY26]|uniref:Guanyl-nucleotide exchange factor n=1 Tax=Schizosaccharomyces cryophilus (strain OY26 / ATCC MYA-4695 / CBS 11777 / NBRC 106824 / NRRL Y48691) TaxID=653667 RepID=S9VT11_SCHCR|nr:guanyl-nucleotide exchange factor [Schizosaccharomyces cryophilus OY26]EPY51013.1 guanyl-nucleotide exchange factor [Schizosaccharomyces cryophilus OY26]
MHRSFSLFRVLELSKTKIECIFELGEYIYVSNSNGDLDRYKIHHGNDNLNDDFVMEHVEFYPTFTKKPITKVIRDASKDIFYALSDSSIHVYKISTFQKLLSVGSHCQNMCLYGNDQIILAERKQLNIYKWQGSDHLVHDKSISLNDRARSLTWMSSTMILVSFSNEFVAVNVETSQSSSLNLPWQPSSSLGLGMSYIGMSMKLNRLHITRISDEEVLLSRDTQGFLVNLKSLHVARKPLVWPTSPQAVIYNSPYLISLHSQYIYVWNKDTHALIQQIGISNISSTFSCEENTFFTSSSYVWILIPEDFSCQVESLLQSNQLDEAISVLDQINDAKFPKRDYYLRMTKREKASRSFSSGDYETAMKLFTEICESPSFVLRLFPKLVENDYSDAISILSSGPSPSDPSMVGSPQRSIQPTSKADSQEQDDGKSLVFNNKRLRSLSTYLTDSRRKANLFLSWDEKTYHSYQKDLFRNEDGSIISKKDLENIAIEVDTTLFLTYMVSTPALVGSLLRLPNHCETSVVEANLTSAGMFRELIDYYFSKGYHDDALKLLTKLNEEGTSLSAPKAQEETSQYDDILNYLQKLRPDEKKIIFEYARIPLGSVPKASVQLFLNDTSGSSTIAHDEVLNYLETVSSEVSIIYLQELIASAKTTLEYFWTRLGQLYLRRIYELERESNYEQSSVVFDAVLKDLIQHLNESKSYDANAILNEIDSDNSHLFEASVILYRRLSKHRDALNVYLDKMKDWKGANGYCDSVYMDTGETEPYYMYLTDLVNERPEDIISFITKYSSRLKIKRIFPLLPKNSSMKTYRTFLSSQFRQLYEEENNKELQSRLYQKRINDLNAELARIRSEKVVITREKTCLHCHKRLGKSVISIFPDGSVVHYGCAKKYLAQRNLPYEAY